MHRRSLALAVAVGAALLLAAALPFVYPFSVSDPRGASGTPGFEQGDAEAFTFEGTLVVDGEVVLGAEGAVSPDGPSYGRFFGDDPDSTLERYRPDGTDGPEYVRAEVPADETAWIQQFREQEEVDLVAERREGDRLVLLGVDDDPSDDLADDLLGHGAVITRSLEIAAYERTGERGGTVALAPQAGWYDEARAWRLTGVRGEVTLDTETGTLRSADVRWELTEGAASYAHYLASERVTQRYAYEYRPGDPDVERPEWVAEIRDQRGD